MAEDRVEGVDSKVAGFVKAAIGKVTGNAQKAASSANDVAHDVVRK